MKSRHTKNKIMLNRKKKTADKVIERLQNAKKKKKCERETLNEDGLECVF